MRLPPGLGTRALSSVLVVLVAAVLVYAPPWLLAPVLLALAGVGLLEMYNLLSRSGHALPVPLGLGLVFLLILSGTSGPPALLNLGVLLAGAAPLAWVMLKGPVSGMLEVWALAALGALYVGWPLAHVHLLRHLPDGQAWLALAIACTWATDTGAYIFGNLFGARKLAPSISPGKTIEGALGALLVTAAVGMLVARPVNLQLGVVAAAFVSLGLSVVAQSGDLGESYMKRVAGVKDSGQLLPGHGGLLDRVDGLLWVVVATYYLAIAAP
ncbi:MAG: phosphatidate cytidylyltransferase [Chloroflexota bacterium]|nr:phosphatidate cytidylyltransferase [Chloroflexota bacterium]